MNIYTRGGGNEKLQDNGEYWVSRLPPTAGPVRVTVVIPSYRAESTLGRALKSVLDQTLRDIEVIVVDDASPDESWDLTMTWLAQDDRVRAIRNMENCGKSVSMNRAVARARGHWLAVLDADDWYHPDRLNGLVGVGEKRQTDMVADNQFFYDSGVDTVVGAAWSVGSADWEMTFDDFLVGANAYDTFNLGMLKPVMRMDFLRRTGLSYDGMARNGQDFFYLLQLYLLGGRAAVSDRPLYFYTQPFGAVSQRWSHAARKRYDFQTAFNINQTYLATAAKSATLRQLGHLADRNRQLQSLENYYAAKDALLMGRWPVALSTLRRHPAIAEYAFRRLMVRYFKNWTTPAAARVAAKCRRRAQTTAVPILGVAT